MTPPAHLLSFDLGRTSGWGWFRYGELSRAWYGKFDELIASPPRGFEGAQADVFIEVPYKAWKSTTEDLIGLGVMVGRVEQFYRMQGCNVKLVKTTWKGSVDADVFVQRVLKALTPEELARVPRRPRAKDVDHNCADGIGLGLVRLGRLR